MCSSDLGSGLFASPNASMIMNSVPARQRGAASGMRMTFMNAGQALSIGIFFSMMVIGLSGTLPGALTSSLHSQGVPTAVAHNIGSIPPVGILFAAFLGYNPIANLLGPSGVLHTLPKGNVNTLTGKQFFPNLISGPFHHGLVLVFGVAAAMMVIGAIAAFFSGSTVDASSSGVGERTGEEPEDWDELGEAIGPRTDGPAAGVPQPSSQQVGS